MKLLLDCPLLKIESVAIQAGRLMLDRLDSLVQERADFAFETTLAARNFARFLRKCKAIRVHHQLNLFLVTNS